MEISTWSSVERCGSHPGPCHVPSRLRQTWFSDSTATEHAAVVVLWLVVMSLVVLVVLLVVLLVVVVVVVGGVVAGGDVVFGGVCYSGGLLWTEGRLGRSPLFFSSFF